MPIIFFYFLKIFHLSTIKEKLAIIDYYSLFVHSFFFMMHIFTIPPSPSPSASSINRTTGVFLDDGQIERNGREMKTYVASKVIKLNNGRSQYYGSVTFSLRWRWLRVDNVITPRQYILHLPRDKRNNCII